MALLSQLNREGDRRGHGHRPIMSDLKDSSSPEQAGRFDHAFTCSASINKKATKSILGITAR